MNDTVGRNEHLKEKIGCMRTDLMFATKSIAEMKQQIKVLKKEA
jgi:hypothetical protein